MVSGRSSPKVCNLPSNNDDNDGTQQLHHDGPPGVKRFDDDVHPHGLYNREKSVERKASTQNAVGESEDTPLGELSHYDSGAVHAGAALGAGGGDIAYEGPVDAGGERDGERDGCDAMGGVCRDSNHPDRALGEEDDQLEREDSTQRCSHHVVAGNGSSQSHSSSVGSQDKTYIHQHQQNGLQGKKDCEGQPREQPQQLQTGDRCLLGGGGSRNSGDYRSCDYGRVLTSDADDDNTTGTAALRDGANDENILARGAGNHEDISDSGEGSNFSAYFNAGGRAAAGSISESDADPGTGRAG